MRRSDDIEPDEQRRLADFLKTFANGGSYGGFAEYHQLEPVAAGVTVDAFGLWPIKATVSTPEEPGEFCFPPLGRDDHRRRETPPGPRRGGDRRPRRDVRLARYTDAFQVVASRDGGLVACPGGPEFWATNKRSGP